MMSKRFLSPERPGGLYEDWPGKYTAFSWLEYVLTIPNPICVVTTRKSSGKANACLHSWNLLVGDSASLSSLIWVLGHTHTHSNILREGEWVLNYPPASVWRQCFATIRLDDEIDEIAQAGLTAEPSETVAAPSVAECPISVECRLKWHHAMGGGTVFCGSVEGARVDPTYLPADPDQRLRSLQLMYNVRGTIDPGSLEMYGPNTIGVLGQVKRISPDLYFDANGQVSPGLANKPPKAD